MESPALLDPRHPSYATERAAFMFAIGTPVQKFVLVEAANQWAVQAIEWLLGEDQMASATCRCMAIFRDMDSVGTRDDMLEEVPYVDFMLDIVDPDKLSQDVVEDAFNRSLSGEEREYANRKIEAEEATAERVSGVVLTATRAPAPVLTTNDEETLLSALTKLGFRKARVQQFLGTVRHRIGRDDIRLLIKDGCKALVA